MNGSSIDRPTPPEGQGDSFAQAKADAKHLLRISRTGALATFDVNSRLPLATLVGVASDWDGSPLFLMSQLARHTRNLADNALGSLLLTTANGRGDPLNQPRLTIGGQLVPHLEPTSKRRYLQRNPKAKLYADFADFALHRMTIESVHFNGGFGRAEDLKPEDLLTHIESIASLSEAEAELLQRSQRLGDGILALLAGAASESTRTWRPVGLDPDGLDLTSAGIPRRVSFQRAAPDPKAWWRQLNDILQSGT